MKPEDLFRQLCSGLGAAAEVQFDPDTGKTLVELPLCYANGDPIALALDRDGGITDNGRTLLRLNTRGQLARFEEEGGFCGLPARLRG